MSMRGRGWSLAISQAKLPDYVAKRAGRACFWICHLHRKRMHCFYFNGSELPDRFDVRMRQETCPDLVFPEARETPLSAPPRDPIGSSIPRFNSLAFRG